MRRENRRLREDVDILKRATASFVQNLRRGHYELATDVPPGLRVASVFADLARAI
ncbi:hypothetical protein OG271_10250 [Micromonospora rifamycinica]|uniref:hypothetical protein n=1 Tax=Micromonospora rifamycinica TaxID=291594 RepID=UPI002E29E7EE|nr:hypothetical protein [Micromonospora rifamycinica]